MKGTSRLVMGATMVMVVSLAIVLTLILVLLAELYCSLLLRKRQLRITDTTTNTASPAQPTQNPSASLSSFYCQGVLRAPRSFLFPAITNKVEEKQDINKQHFNSEQVPESQTQEPIKTPHQIALIYASSPSPSFMSVPSPQKIQEVTLEASSSGGGDDGEHFVYISNPIYENSDCRRSRVCTPFETPGSSPSRLEMGNWSGDNDENVENFSSNSSSLTLPITPPLSPMKKLPMEACSVSLRDARSLGTSGSESNNGQSSSSSSGRSPCTSPSW